MQRIRFPSPAPLFYPFLNQLFTVLHLFGSTENGNKSGNIPLLEAARNGQQETVELLSAFDNPADEVVDARRIGGSGCRCNRYQIRVTVSGCAEAGGGCAVFAQIIRETRWSSSTSM